MAVFGIDKDCSLISRGCNSPEGFVDTAKGKEGRKGAFVDDVFFQFGW